jgi:hypothetical protein
MVSITFRGESVLVDPVHISKYNIEGGASLEQVIKDQFNPYSHNFENIERELKGILGRDPEDSEVYDSLNQ